MKNILFIAFLFIVSATHAQERWSLQGCIATAYRNSPVVEQNQLLAKQNRNALTQSRFALMPTLSASVIQNFFWGRAIDFYTNQFSDQSSRSQGYNLDASINIFSGTSSRNTIIQNGLLAQAAQADIQQSKDQLSILVMGAYLSVLGNEDALLLAQKQVEVTKAQIERSEALVGAGSVAAHVLLDLKAQLANDEMSIISAKNNIKSARLQLLQAMNAPYTTNFTLERLNAAEQLMSQYETSATQISDLAHKNFAIMKAANLRIDATQKGIEIAKGRMLPTVFGYGSVSTRYSTTAPFAYGRQLEGNLFKYLGVQLNIPIFNGYQNRTRWQNAQIAQQIAKAQAKNTSNQLRQAIDLAYINMEQAQDCHKGIEAQAKALAESFEGIESRFSAGNLTILEYTTAKTNMDRAKMNLLQAQYEYLFRTKILDFYQSGKVE